MDLSDIGEQLQRAVRRALSEQNLDPYAPGYGCFDRRFWAWKLTDFPDATYQRLVLLLAWQLQRSTGAERRVLESAVRGGIDFAISIQHADGSWDQAFPHEHSFGATAFLLHPLLVSYRAVAASAAQDWHARVEAALRSAAEFLCRHDESHGHIANHRAGAVLSLLAAADHFSQPRYERRAAELLDGVFRQMSPEGWFLEYDGADPGYQTLCMYYLAAVRMLRPSPALDQALRRAAEFLSWFVHPDGSFGGEYGCRRTAIFYPGGVALLAAAGNRTAAAMVQRMVAGVRQGRTVRLDQIDVGNLAPLSANYATLLETAPATDAARLPYELEGDVQVDFPAAGLYVRSSRRYWVIVGASNGGTVKVFDRVQGLMMLNDGGYVGRERSGTYLTTQHTGGPVSVTASADAVSVRATFAALPRGLPTPAAFIPLRTLNLTAMRSVRIGNAVKRALVRRLMRSGSSVPLTLDRTVHVAHDSVTVRDRVSGTHGARLEWLECGVPFAAIHMASARYYENPEALATSPRRADVAELARAGEVMMETAV
jgi:hypothetical protein